MLTVAQAARVYGVTPATVRDPMGTTAAVASRAFKVPASRIRKWVYRGKIHRFPDGSLDPACVASRVALDLDNRADVAAFHDRKCHVRGMID